MWSHGFNLGTEAQLEFPSHPIIFTMVCLKVHFRGSSMVIHGAVAFGTSMIAKSSEIGCDFRKNVPVNAMSTLTKTSPQGNETLYQMYACTTPILDL